LFETPFKEEEMRQESPLVTAAKVWWDFRAMCLMHIILVTFGGFFVTEKTRQLVSIVGLVGYMVVYLVLLRATKNGMISIIIVIFNAFVAPFFTTIFLYPLLMAIGQKFFGM